MIYKNPDVILPETLSLLRQIQQDDFFDDFFLVGGTALALQIDHRLSIDLDFFSLQPFDNQQLEAHLSEQYGFQTDYVATNTLKGFVQNVKVDFLTHAYPLVKPLIPLKGITWFEDIDFKLEKPMLKRKISFGEVKKRLLEATKKPEKVF